MARRVSRKGVRFVARFEGFVDHAYKPVPSEPFWTIGYGHYGSDVHQGDRITKRQARKLLRKDLGVFSRGVRRLVHRRLRQRDLDALTSFAFNNGLGSLETSTLLRRWNAGEARCKVAQEELPKWVHASGGIVLAGLVARRKAEVRLICSGHYR